MPKERFSIKTFNGAAPATGDAESPIRFENARVDVANNVAVPENVDAELENSDVILIEKKMYVDGVERYLRIYQDGEVRVNEFSLGDADISTVPDVDVIGRQAVISGRGNAKFIRVGHPGKGTIYFDNDDIIFEDDYISSMYFNFGDVQDFLVPNSENYLVLYGGDNRLSMHVVLDDSYRSAPLCGTKIEALAYDVKAYTVGETVEDHGYIDNVYYAYYDENDVIKVKKFFLSQCYTAGKSNGIDFDDTLFASEDRIGTTTITVDLDAEDLPSGYRLNSIAVTATKLFLGFVHKSGPGVVQLTQDNVLTDEQELLFAFNLTLFASSVIVSVGGANPLYKSYLPWNPYREYTGVRVETPSAHSGETHGDASSRFFLPREVQWQISGSPYNSIGILSFVVAAQQGGWAAGVFDGDIPLPGGCGVVNSNISPMGSLCVIDYDNDVVGYLVKYASTGTFPIAHAYDAEGHTTSTAVQNGAGKFVCEREDAYIYRIKSDGISLINESDPGSNIGSGYIHAFYCWNGIQIPDDYGGYKYKVWAGFTGIEDNYVYITRHFDDANTQIYARGVSDDHARFLLIPNTHISSDANGATSSVSIIDGSGGDARSVISFNGSVPVLTVPYDTGGNLINMAGSNIFEVGQQHIITWEDDDAIKYPALTHISPDQGDVMLTKHLSSTYVYAPVAIDDDLAAVTITLDSTEDFGIPLISATANTELSDSFDANTIVRYKIAFTYDGTSSSPLSTQYVDVTNAGAFDVNIVLRINTNTLRVVSRRITSIDIYATTLDVNEENDLYRLVKSVPLTSDYFSVSDDVGAEDGDYKYLFTDTNIRLASFNANAGYSETQKTVSVSRKCQCICNNYLFAGNVTIDSGDLVGVNTDNLVVRSLPFQPSIFNYSEEFCVLPFTPIALVPFNSRVYAFGSEQYAIINSDSLAIEHISNSCGISDKDHAVTTDYGIFVYYNHNLYHVNNAEVKSIGDVVRENNSGTYAMSLADFGEEVFVGYVQSRNAVVILGCREETDSQDSIVMMFAYGIATGKWSSYEISEASTDYPISLYDKDDSAVFTMYTSDGIRSEYRAFKLFAGAEKREMLLEWIMYCGDPDQDKFIYSVDTYNGRTPTSADVLVDGAPLKADTDAYNTLAPLNTFTLRVSDDTALSEIRLLMRRMVVHNE
jgi:hypothetical protein